MTRRKKYNIDTSVVDIVKAVCADYSRRSRALLYSLLDDTIRREYLRLNSAIDKALEDNVEEGVRGYIFSDIQLGRGYDFSLASPFYAKNTYYQRKRKIIHDIAAALNLI